MLTGRNLSVVDESNHGENKASFKNGLENDFPESTVYTHTHTHDPITTHGHTRCCHQSELRTTGRRSREGAQSVTSRFGGEGQGGTRIELNNIIIYTVHIAGRKRKSILYE